VAPRVARGGVSKRNASEFGEGKYNEARHYCQVGSREGVIEMLRPRTVIVVTLFALSVVVCAEPPEWTPCAKPPTFAFLVTFGLNASTVADYGGKAAVTPGEVVKVEGWHFEATDKITGADSWQCTSHLSVPRKLSPDEIARGAKEGVERPLPIGVIVYVDAPMEATAEVTTAAGSFSVKLADLKYGQAVPFLNGMALVRRVPISQRLTEKPAMHDYPSIAYDANGNLYMVWLSWEPDADQPLARCMMKGQWGEVMKLAPEAGDNFETQVGVAGDGAVWAVWSSRQGTNWDLWGRRIDGGKLGKLERLTTDKGAEFYHAMASDAQGRLWLAWQSARRGQYDIYVKCYENGRWGKEIQVSTDATNDWEPAVAGDGAGNVYVAWDGYRNGNYDIFLRAITDGKLSDVRQVTTSPRHEVHVSLAVDKQDRLWLAWEEGQVLWGKDQGFLVPGRGFSRLHSPRKPKIVCLENNEFKEPESDLVQAFPQGLRSLNEYPEVFFDNDGRLWVVYRRSEHKSGRGGGSGRTIWHDHAAYWDGTEWRAEIWIPYTNGRQDMRLAAVAAPQGGLTMAWASDERPWRNPIPGDYQNPGANNIYMTHIAADWGTADLPPLKTYEPTPVAEMAVDLHPKEAEDVARRRAARWEVGGKTYMLLTGETHRHTDVSFDGGGDGSMYDMMRYEIDAVRQEFIAAWDHDNGGGQDYAWWQSQKVADLFYIEDVFEPLYGYERSVNYPDGHRNVTFAHRGVRPFDRVRIPNPDQAAKQKFVLSPDDTKKLYAYLKANNGICFSHTSATDMGTDWRDNDPEVEPVVEIYQGCRTSYEYEGAPRAATADNVAMQIGGFRPAGFVWNALAKGYRLGIMAASDHGSTHISYAGVWTTEFSREAIFQAFKKRHCFGATDNIVLMFGTDKQMMGDEFTATEAPVMKVKVLGTAPIRIIEVIKDNKIVYAYTPQEQEKVAEMSWRDNESGRGTSYYYVRVQQTDDQIAWSSPMWVTYRGG
jgi:hypothetical protein